MEHHRRAKHPRQTGVRGPQPVPQQGPGQDENGEPAEHEPQKPDDVIREDVILEDRGERYVQQRLEQHRREGGKRRPDGVLQVGAIDAGLPFGQARLVPVHHPEVLERVAAITTRQRIPDHRHPRIGRPGDDEEIEHQDGQRDLQAEAGARALPGRPSLPRQGRLLALGPEDGVRHLMSGIGSPNFELRRRLRILVP